VERRRRDAGPCFQHFAAKRGEVGLAQPLGVGAQLLELGPGELLDALARPFLGAPALENLLLLRFVGDADKAS
jgi:hypothetical protein